MDALDRARPAQRSREPGVLYLLASVPLFVALWCAPILPTHDGPKQLYSAHVRFHVDDPAFASSFDPAYPPTSVGFTLLYGLLEKLFSWRVAYGLAWTIAVALLPIAIWQLARAFDAKRAPLCLLGFAGAIHWSVHMGLANYVPSIGLGLLAIGIGIASDTWSVRRELSIYALLSLTCLFHPVGAQLAAVGLFVFRALGTSKPRVVRELGAMALGCAPAVAITLVTRDTLADLLAKGIIPRAVPQALSLAERIENFTDVFLCGPLWRSVPVLVVAAAGVVLAVGGLSRALLRRAPRTVDRRVVSLVVVVAISLALALSTPLHGEVWEFMQPRFIPPAVFAALVLAPIERLTQRAHSLVAAAFFACAIASNAWVVDQHLRFAKQHQDAFSGLGIEARPGRTLLPIVAREESGLSFQHERNRPIPYASFIFNLGQIYAVDREAVTPYSFSFLPNIHPIQYVAGMGRTPRRDYGDLFKDGADPLLREKELMRLASFGVDFDDVLFYGAEEDVTHLVALGYRTETRRGGFMIGHFVGCPIEVAVDAGISLGALVVGWAPSDRAVYLLASEAGGPRSFVIERCEVVPAPSP
jgi:hypothetical protein